ncbi:torsin-3A [Ambystoma mexicanum]|uniref:torsin-3A n=1 Tax=Ambystoma mexicanum TaxID=8296 RepID=UPI0037E8EB7C
MAGMPVPASLLACCCLLLLLGEAVCQGRRGEHAVSAPAEEWKPAEQTVPIAENPGHQRGHSEPRTSGQGQLGENPVPRAGELEHQSQQAGHRAGELEHQSQHPVPRTGELELQSQQAVPRAGELEHQGQQAGHRASEYVHLGDQAMHGTSERGHQSEQAVPRASFQGLQRMQSVPRAAEKEQLGKQEGSEVGVQGQLGQQASPGTGRSSHLREQAGSRAGEQGHSREQILPRAEEQGHSREQILPSAGKQWQLGEQAVPRAAGQEQAGHGEGAVQKQLEALMDFARRYWHRLSNHLWPEECAKEDGAGKTGWTLPLVGQVYLEMLTSWYCSVWDCDPRDCKVSHNMTGLELDLSRRLHGQHLAREVVLRFVPTFLQDRHPRKALTLSFHGWSGTGKNFVTRLMAENLYREGMKSDCVKVFIAQLHFPHPRYVELYKVQLKKQLSETNWRCKRALFIFDEAEKLHPGLVDALRPYVSSYEEAGDEDYRQSIFLFLSNIGGNAINEVARNFWRAGRRREEMTLGDLEKPLRAEMAASPDDDFVHSRLQAEDLIDALVPFLPLEYKHVKLCARDAFLARGLPHTQATLDQVARMMIFVPKEEKLFSASGCKSVSQRINYL